MQKNTLTKLISLPFFPVLVTPFLLFLFPLLRGEVLFWGLPVLQFIPWRAFTWQLLSQGIIPLWNPFNGMGAPLLANYQLAVFYPPGWLIYLANALGGVPANAWMQTLLIPLHLAFCGAGMALVGKRLGFTALAQAIMGLAFSLSGYFVARAGFFSMVWAGAWLPWMIYFASSFSLPILGLDRSKKIIVPGLIICIAMQLLSGHAQLSWYSLVFTGVWVMIGGWLNEGWKGAFRSSGIFALNGLLAASLAAMQLLPTAEYLLQSQRSSAVDAELGLTYSFWPWRFLSLLAPGLFGNPSSGNYWGYASYWEDALYIGVLPLFLALTSLKKLFLKKSSDANQPFIRFCWVIIIVACLFALGNNTPVFSWLYRYVPTFSLFNAPARWMFWAVFCLSLLAGLSASTWARPVGRSMRRYKRFTVASLAVTIGAVAAWASLRNVQTTFIEATVMLGIWATGACALTILLPKETEGKAYQRWMWLAVTWVVIDLVWASWGGQPFIPADYFADQVALPKSETNARVYMDEKDEYDLKFHRFFRFSDYFAIEDWQNLKTSGLPNLNLLSDKPVPFVNNFDPFVPGRFAKWIEVVNELDRNQQESYLNMMNVGASFDRDIKQPVVGVSKPANPGTRTWWAGCAIWVPDETKSLQEVKTWLELTDHPEKKRLILEGASGLSPQDCNSDLDLKPEILVDRPNEIQISVNSSQDGFLFLADTWFPGWAAQVDGQPAEIYHANYLFRAVAVKAGKHTVTFYYSPKSFYIGAGISLACISFMILWLLLLKHRVK